MLTVTTKPTTHRVHQLPRLRTRADTTLSLSIQTRDTSLRQPLTTRIILPICPVSTKGFCFSGQNLSLNFLVIHSRIYKVPLQETYSEALPAQPQQCKLVLSNLQNVFPLFLSNRRISNESPFQVEGPTMENARCCLVEVVIIINTRTTLERVSTSVWLIPWKALYNYLYTIQY